MRNYFSGIVGNQKLTERLSMDIEENKIPHALIIEGDTGSRRHTVVKYFAAALSCERRNGSEALPCRKCPSCEKIFGEKSPDIIKIGLEGEKTSIGVDAVRFLKTDIFVEPNDLKYKFYIIEDAEKMTVQAQNAFLLSLEEPPPYVVFILICNNSSLLLETVRSRALTVRTERLSPQIMRDYLLTESKEAKSLFQTSGDEFEELLLSCGGSIGRALMLLNSKERKKLFSDRDIASKIISLAADRDLKKAFDILSALGQKRQEICQRLLLVQTAVRDLIVLKKCEKPELCFYTDTEKAGEISTHFTLSSLFDIYGAAAEAVDCLEKNANVRLTLLNMFIASKLL